MPDKPTFLIRIPAALERLRTGEDALFVTPRHLSKLLGCSQRNARRIITRSPAARRDSIGWTISTGDLARLLVEIYERYGGVESVKRFLDELESRTTEKVRVPDVGVGEEADGRVLVVPRSASAEVPGPAVVLRGRTVKEILAAAAILSRRVARDREYYADLDRELKR